MGRRELVEPFVGVELDDQQLDFGADLGQRVELPHRHDALDRPGQVDEHVFPVNLGDAAGDAGFGRQLFGRDAVVAAAHQRVDRQIAERLLVLGLHFGRKLVADVGRRVVLGVVLCAAAARGLRRRRRRGRPGRHRLRLGFQLALSTWRPVGALLRRDPIDRRRTNPPSER